MRNGRWLVMAVIFCLSGCSFCKTQCPTDLQAMWYMVRSETPFNNQEQNQNQSDVMYVALLNQGRCPIQVENIILNPTGDQKGWRLKQDHETDLNIELVPGEILFRPVSDFKDGLKKEFMKECHIPVAVNVKIEGQNEAIRAKLIGTMPTSVPEGWEKACEGKSRSK